MVVHGIWERAWLSQKGVVQGLVDSDSCIIWGPRGPCLYLHAAGPGNFWSACQMLTETGGRGEGFRYVWFPPAAAFGM